MISYSIHAVAEATVLYLVKCTHDKLQLDLKHMPCELKVRFKA